MRTLISWLLFACTVASDCDVKEIAERVERGPAQAECLLQRSGQLGEALAFEEDGLPCAGFCAGNSKPWEKKCNWRKCKGCAACAQPAGCLPSTTFSGWGDAGYPDNFRGWYDVQGCGKCHDYCRWVGASGSGGDPKEKLTHQQSYWSCRLAGTSAIHSPNGAFQSWNFDKCSGEGAVAPAPAPPATPYVPGSPGAAWSEHELRVVRAKIHRIINEGDKVFDELGLQVEERWTSVPSAGKLLRLGFHDCLRYKDGTGGCDGCLEWKGVGVRIPRADLERGKFPGDGEGDGHNNGLGYVVEVLEAIYTDRSFPGKTPQLSLSLQQSGKSRADLWAFAAIVAVEYSLELNNMVCDNPTILQPDQCHPREGQPDCSLAMPRPIIFKTGRKDCLSTGSPTYKQDKEEAHPDPQANGQGTVGFFKRDFNFNGRETVAIMGAHTLGRVHVINSLFRYTWKATSEKLFNNGYFRNLAKKRDWYYPTGATAPCKRVGNATGHRPVARWMPHVRGDTVAGGPVQWLQEKLVCPHWNPDSEEMDTCDESELKWKFVIGKDETALPCEMGLYVDFQVDANGIPSGCPGFEDFNMEKWGMINTDTGGLNNYKYTWTRIDGKPAEPTCPFQKLAEPSGSTPLHQIVEDFADNATSWLETFIPTFEKMLANGYESELQATPPTDGSFVKCPFQDARDAGRYYSCSA